MFVSCRMINRGFTGACGIYDVKVETKLLAHIVGMFQDILFDASVHKVKKFILHTNYPGHYDFNM